MVGYLLFRRRPAFTLVEILIVVVLLGILAAIVVPNVSGVSHQSRESVLRDELRFMRTQIVVYGASHSIPPGVDVSGTASESVFVSQMTGMTDYQGNVSTTSSSIFSFGPYLSQIPSNPFLGKTGVKIASPGQNLVDLVDESAAYGWIYQPSTLQFCANSTAYGPAGLNW